MQPAPQSVCLNMQPYDGVDRAQDPALYPQVRSVAVQEHPDFVLWSLFNFFFLNFCCLGFAALVFSIKSRDRKVVGDPDGAASYGKTARCLNITSLVLSITFVIIFIIAIVSVVTSMS
uniref:Interferon-induced transmembrane protein 1-like n=1 Tax=Pogona vitticeps TaxID=103695 RepID=A0A6J0SXT8_9SAUR|nr:interferon-induced transmembrane protein 3-like [Pogona vitticeps]